MTRMESQAIQNMIESLKKIQEDNEQFRNSNAQIMERLERLETEKPPVKVEKSQAHDSGGSSGTTQVVVQGAAKEKSLSLTFGDDESPMALKLFVEHYNLAKSQNMRKNVEGWQEKEFRANELRFQLRGRVAAWVLQENAMHSEWVKDDVEIIKKLQERYLGTMSVELNIIAFEELRQREGETLAEYMTRCQEKGYHAFADFNPIGVQQRIVWKFLYGIRDSDVRAEVIRAKWMASSSEAKPFAEVLKIAETAKLAKTATAATGRGKTSESGVSNKVAAVSKVEERRNSVKSPTYSRGSGYQGGRSPHSSSESNGSRGSRGSTGSAASRTSTGSDIPGQNFLCHYCKERSHYGGWKNCEKRRTENPGWKPNF